MVLILGLSFLTSAYAGREDWEGLFVVKDENSDNSFSIKHTTKEVIIADFLHIVNQCHEIRKGNSINGVVSKDNANLCVDSNIATFTSDFKLNYKLIFKSKLNYLT